VRRGSDGRGATAALSRSVRLVFPEGSDGRNGRNAGVRIRLLSASPTGYPLLEGWVQLELLRVAQRMGASAEN